MNDGRAIDLHGHAIRVRCVEAVQVEYFFQIEAGLSRVFGPRDGSLPELN